MASQPPSLSSPKFQSLDSKSAQTHEIVILCTVILMLIHVIFKIIKPYHTHIVNHIKLSRLVQNGSASISPGFFSAIAHLQGRKNGCPALRHHPWGPRTSSPRGTSGPSWWGCPRPFPPSIRRPSSKAFSPTGPRGGQLGHDHCQQRVRGVDPNLHRALHQRLASERLLVTSKTPRANNMDGDFCWDSSCGCW